LESFVFSFIKFFIAVDFVGHTWFSIGYFDKKVNYFQLFCNNLLTTVLVYSKLL
jgi:hypothetical protein